MPHFIIECSEDIILNRDPELIMQAVYATAEATGLFAEDDIKVRLIPFTHYRLGKTKTDFLHVFGYIMQGRTTAQRAMLSESVIVRLNGILPGLSVLSMNISEFEKDTYSNKALIHPLNRNNDRHFNSSTTE